MKPTAGAVYLYCVVRCMYVIVVYYTSYSKAVRCSFPICQPLPICHPLLQSNFVNKDYWRRQYILFSTFTSFSWRRLCHSTKDWLSLTSSQPSNVISLFYYYCRDYNGSYPVKLTLWRPWFWNGHRNLHIRKGVKIKMKTKVTKTAWQLNRFYYFLTMYNGTSRSLKHISRTTGIKTGCTLLMNLI